MVNNMSIIIFIPSLPSVVKEFSKDPTHGECQALRLSPRLKLGLMRLGILS